MVKIGKYNVVNGHFKNDGTPTDLSTCDYMTIPLLGSHAKNDNAVMKISKSNVDFVLNYSWYLGKDGYPVTYGSIDGAQRFGRGLKIHQFLKGSYGNDYAIDHINRDKMDNRLENLRICTKQENNYNRSKPKNSQYNYKGVRQERDGTFTAYVTKDGEKHEIKKLPDELTAAKIYDMMAEDLLGNFAPKNFN